MSRYGPSSTEDQGNERTNPSHVLLMMASTGDRSILKDWLGRQYAVSVGTDAEALDQAFDCCLVDEAMFARHHDALAERKRQAQPTFLPYLLVLDGREASPDEPRLWEHIDDLLRAPVRKAELQSRLVGLLNRRNLSKALAEQQERYQRILRTIPDPLFVLNDTGAVVESNPAFEETFGLEMGEEATPLDAIPALPEEAVATLRQFAELGQVENTTERADEPPATTASVSYFGREGTSRTAEVAMAPLGAGPDGTGGTLFVLRDVTDRLNRQKALERERERLSEFASMLAHEVRNPLNIAQGYLQQVTPDSEEEHDAIARVIAAQARMEQMIKELLAHARDGAIVSVEPVNLRAVAETAWGATPSGETTLELDVDDETLNADPENLQTILENLFRNAVDHAGTDVTVQVGVLEDGGFYVEDDGPGIPPEDRERVFERGFTTSSEGSGLGLTLVQQMAEAHGWDVRVTDSNAGGARFEFAVGDDAPKGTDGPD